MYTFLMDETESEDYGKCTCSAEREGEYSAASFWDIPASVLSRLNLTVGPF